MSIRWLPPKLHLVVAIGVAVLLFASGTLFALRSGEADVRTIEVVAQSMVFDGDNPTFWVRPGERVAFRLVNLDTGMKHDLAIPELDAATPKLVEGESATLLVTFPKDSVGKRYLYLCTLHPLSMRGWIEVVPE